MAGLIALCDPPRADSVALVKELNTLGVRAIMLTGDAPATASSVARAVGLDGKVAPAGVIPTDVRPEQFSVFAGIFPRENTISSKPFRKAATPSACVVTALTMAPHSVRLRWAIAVSTATDIAKSAAGIVLTEPGLGGIVASVKQGRVIFQRILTYTLNSTSNKIVKIFFLAVGLVMTGHAILTPLLIMISMLSGDLPGSYISPMLYPSSFQAGIPGLRNSLSDPYRLVFASLQQATQCTGFPGVTFRPWLQAFNDYAFDHRIFGKVQIEAQIKAAQDAGSGWMLWDARNRYPGEWSWSTSVANWVGITVRRQDLSLKKDSRVRCELGAAGGDWNDRTA